MLGFMIGMTIGCGSDDHEEELAVDESIYSAGEPVAAIGYSDAQPITLYLRKTNSRGSYYFSKVGNGEILAAGVNTFGIKVNPRMVEGKAANQRVFLGDGGWDNQVEAVLDEENGYYVCDFTLVESDVYLTHPLLVQVIYPYDNKASKEKFVVITDALLRPASNALVQNGMGITLSAAMLETMKEIINPLIQKQMPNVEIKSITPAKNDTDSEKGIMNINLGALSFDLALQDTYTNTQGNRISELTIGIADLAGGASNKFMENLLSLMLDPLLKRLSGPIVNIFQLDQIPMMPVALSLDELLPALMESEDGEGMSGILPSDLFAGFGDIGEMLTLSAKSVLFLNIFGLPQDTDSNFAAIGGGIHAISSDLAQKTSKGTFIWPDVVVDSSSPSIDLDYIKTASTDMGVALSQYNLNRLLPEIMRGLQVRLANINELIPIISPENPENSLDISLAINPEGAAIDMRHHLSSTGEPVIWVVMNDVRAEFIEAGTPKTLLSVDLNLEVVMDFYIEEDKPFLEMTIKPLEDISHIHVLKDDLGMDMFDHSRFIPIIFQFLFGTGGNELVIPISLSDMGIVPKAGADPGKVSFDGLGNCFMSIEADGIDLSTLSTGGGCFVSTASSFL